jgi:hypothetical protein
VTGPGKPARRDGTEDDIAGMRIYYRGPDKVERHVDWDRRLMTVEAVALKKTAQVTPRQVMAAVVDYVDDADATRALVWMLRRFRGGEDKLTLLQVDVDLLSIRDEWIDGAGVEVNLFEKDLDAELVAVVAKSLLAQLPALDPQVAGELATAAVRNVPKPEDGPGESGAGGEPAAEPTPPTT